MFDNADGASLVIYSFAHGQFWDGSGGEGEAREMRKVVYSSNWHELTPYEPIPLRDELMEKLFG